MISVPLISVSVPLPIPHCLVYNSFIINLKLKYSYSTNFLLFQSCFGYLFPLSFHVYFIISLSIPINSPTEILVGATLNLLINLGRIHILIMLNFSIHERGMSLHLLSSSYICVFQCSVYKSCTCFLIFTPKFMPFLEKPL